MLPWSFEKEKWEQCSLQQTLLCHPSFTQSTWPFHMHWPLLGTPSPLSMALYLREIRWHWVSNESSTAASSLSAWAARCSAVAWHCFPSPLESGTERAGRDGTVYWTITVHKTDQFCHINSLHRPRCVAAGKCVDCFRRSAPWALSVATIDALYSYRPPQSFYCWKVQRNPLSFQKVFETCS